MILNHGRIVADGTAEELARRIAGEDQVRWTRDGRQFAQSTTALRAGWSRGVIELRQSLTNAGDLLNHFFWPVLMLVTLFFLRDVSFGQSGFLLGTLVLPGILGKIISVSGGLIVDLAISGVFYPITAMPEWLQWLAQVFPVYWLGLDMRSAFLPDNAVAVEIGESWRHLETAAVLGAWAVIGLIVAPVVLRRMARRESGSVVAGRRDKTLQRVV
ncbi:ABC transporter permease [Amycolatopsis lurida]